MSAERSAKFGTSERCRPDLGVLWRADHCLEPEEPQLNTPDSRESEAIHSSPPTGFERGTTPTEQLRPDTFVGPVHNCAAPAKPESASPAIRRHENRFTLFLPPMLKQNPMKYSGLESV